MHAPEKFEKNRSAKRDVHEAIPILLSKMSPWKRNELVLDYGCGPGSTGHSYFQPLAQDSDSLIHAVDSASEMIAYGKLNFSSPHVEFIQGNIMDDDSPLLKNQYDRIFAIQVFHFIKDYREAMQRFYRILKPGGEFAFMVMIRAPHFSMFQMMGEHPKFSEYMKGYEAYISEWFQEKECAIYGQGCFEKAAKSSGFEVAHSKLHYQRNALQMESLIETYLAVNPYLPNIPCHLLEEFREAHRQAISEFHNIDIDSKTVIRDHEMLSMILRKPLCSPIMQ